MCRQAVIIAGVEYWYAWASIYSLLITFITMLSCAVCYVATRSVTVMIPAKTRCPTDWTVEYVGYLMTEYYNHDGRLTFECVDKES